MLFFLRVMIPQMPTMEQEQMGMPMMRQEQEHLGAPAQKNPSIMSWTRTPTPPLQQSRKLNQDMKYYVFGEKVYICVKRKVFWQDKLFLCTVRKK